MLDTFIR